jgi:NADH dehydrogenase [ubiquinone] 1 alpha subcomplex assembly factor 7
MSLPDILRAQIRASGPMDLGAFMALALGHPQHGYYMTRDPFGARGDFTTAPEISQMFGELIGAWLADMWLKLGSPARLTLAELGPGRGTLMQDALRATRNAPGFHAALDLRLVEMSPVLRRMQEERLGAYRPRWHTEIATLPDDAPLLIVANEFLDALPVRHLVGTAQGVMEKAVGLDSAGGLCFGLVPCFLAPPFPLAEGETAEIGPARDGAVREMAGLLGKAGGAALIIDYGYEQARPGETLQALRGHEYVDPLAEPGEADLTAHVDFGALRRVSAVPVRGPVPQGLFLKRLGIEHRARVLGDAAGLERLVSPAQMGELFKVAALCHDREMEIAGFEGDE